MLKSMVSGGEGVERKIINDCLIKNSYIYYIKNIEVEGKGLFIE